MKRPTRLLVASTAALAAASVALATTYVRVEKDGSKTYSDRPLPGGQPVELQSAQTYSAPPATPNPNLPAEQRLLQSIDDFLYSSCTLSPAKDETFVNPQSVAISVRTEPPLRAGDIVNFTVNGQPAGTSMPSFSLTPADRGTHQVRVSIKDRHGRELCTSTTEFHVRRPSLNSPRRRG